MRSCRPRTGNARTQTEPSRSGKGRALRAVAMSLAQGNESEAGHRAGLPDAGHGLAASSPRRPLPPMLSGRAPSGSRGRPAPRFQPCALLVHSQPQLGRGRRRGRGRGMPGPRTGAGGGLGCSKKVTLFPFHWIKRLKLCLAFAVPQDRPASAETCPPSPPGAAAASRARVRGTGPGTCGRLASVDAFCLCKGDTWLGSTGPGAASPTAGRRARPWQGS